MPYLKGEAPTNQDSECIFCHKARAKNDRAEHILARGMTCFITLNLYPYNNGHLLVVPYRHVGTLDELEPAEAAEMMALTQQAIKVLRAAYAPQGFNIGINQGEAAGAGVAGHLHQHVVPRWSGDTNYMTVVGETRIIPEWIDDTHVQLQALWAEMFSDNPG